MPKKPEWHEEDHPSHSEEVEGVRAPMAFSAGKKRSTPKPDADKLEKALLKGDRTALGQAITLIESQKPEHRAVAEKLLERLYPLSGKSLRIGITGVPGVGKSTFIEAMGTRLCKKGRRLAVLTVDPSSELTGGSVLGDKTRMESLSRESRAFIRPSPSRGVLGGVARWTREAMIVCEAAGYDTIFIETVGVGQSEALVRGMVDCFLFLSLPGAGDELQGLKKGILELADILAVNKADGDNLPKAQAAKAILTESVKYLQHATAEWTPPVHMISAAEGTGLEELWQAVQEFEKKTQETGVFAQRRHEQKAAWLKILLRDSIAEALEKHPHWPQWLKAAKEELPTLTAKRVLKDILKNIS